MKKIKVLHIITSLGSGGSEGMLYRLIIASNSYIEHSVICLNKGGKYVSKMQKANVDVIALNLNFYNFFKGVISIFKFARSKKKENYQIITSWLYHSDLVAWFVKILCGYKGLYWNIRYTNLQKGQLSLKNWFILKILSILSNFKVDEIISCSKTAAEILKKIGYKKDIFNIIPNGYFIENEKKFNRELKNYNGLYKICIVARWHPQKDFENIFKALDLLKSRNIPFHLTIAGNNTGPENQELFDLIKNYTLEDFCSLLGEVDNVNDIYSNSHITVLSSAYGEAFPNVLAESMLNYTPCISTDIGDATTILSDVGFIVPIGDYKSLCDTLIENHRILIEENEIYLKNCIKCFEKVKYNYDIKYIARDYHNMWKKLF